MARGHLGGPARPRGGGESSCGGVAGGVAGGWCLHRGVAGGASSCGGVDVWGVVGRGVAGRASSRWGVAGGAVGALRCALRARGRGRGGPGGPGVAAGRRVLPVSQGPAWGFERHRRFVRRGPRSGGVARAGGGVFLPRPEVSGVGLPRLCAAPGTVGGGCR